MDLSCLEAVYDDIWLHHIFANALGMTHMATLLLLVTTIIPNVDGLPSLFLVCIIREIP